MLIDVHAHQFPQPYTALMARHGRQLLGILAGATLDERIGQMDEAQVDLQVLSPSNLMPYLENEADAGEAARILNDGYAELTHRLPIASRPTSPCRFPISRRHCARWSADSTSWSLRESPSAVRF